jgi:hypothetical protein
MRKILTVVALLSMVAPALGQEAGHRVGHGVGHHSGHVPLPPPRPYGRDGRNILPWVAGGVTLGILSGAYWYNNRRCYDEMVGYDRRGREVWEINCN